MVGTTIAQYRITEKIGQGGMGIVYKAQDTKLDRTVALKFLPEHLNASAQDKARFVQEAKAASSLNHPNVCTIHDIQEEDGRLFIVMEFVDGQTLRERKSTLSLKQAVDIAVQIADGLAAAHEKGIVHRDIKPDNIMIRKDGIAQIMDFGLAKLRGVSALTKEGSTIGTAGYMSPEQVQGLDADHRSDIFSLGVVLFELFTGQLPFKGVHETALMYEIVNVDAPPPSSIKPEIDVELDRIVLDCLQKERDDRAQSAREVSRDLKRFKRESGRQHVSRISGTRAAYVPPAAAGAERTREDAPAPARRSSLVPWIVAGVAVLAAVALGVLSLTKTVPAAPLMRTAILPGAHTQTIEYGALALSPDGSMLVYAAEDSVDSRLWLRPLNSVTPIPLQGTEGALFPFWSPDNRFIAFFADRKLKKVEARGSSVTTICDAANPTGGSWSAEGTILFTSLRQAGLFKVSSQGGTPVSISIADSANEDLFYLAPCFLPDGNHFLYTSYTKPMVVATRTKDNAIFVGALDSDERRLLIQASSNAVAASGHILFVRDNTLLAQEFDAGSLAIKGEPKIVAEQLQYSERYATAEFAASQTGLVVYQNRVVTLSGIMVIYGRNGERIESMGGVQTFDDPVFSPDGARYAYTIYEKGGGRGDIWIADPARGTTSRFTFSPAEEDDPVWSADGSTIVYSLEGDLVMKPSSGIGEPQFLYRSKNDKVPTDLSRDGKYLVYGDFGGSTGRDVWVLPMTGDRKPIPFATSEFTEQGGSFSPDGRWLAYSSNETGRYEVYIQSFPASNGKWQISTAGGILPRWTGTGKELCYVDAKSDLISVPIAAAGSTVQAGTPQMLFRTKLVYTSGPGHRYDVSADGLRFILNDVQEGELHAEPLHLVSNWTSELQR